MAGTKQDALNLPVESGGKDETPTPTQEQLNRIAKGETGVTDVDEDGDDDEDIAARRAERAAAKRKAAEDEAAARDEAADAKSKELGAYKNRSL